MIEAVVFCRRSTPSHAYCTHTSSICLRHGHLLVQACTHPPMFRVSAWPPTGPGMHPPTHVPCVRTATHWSRPAPTHPCSVCLHGHLLVQACTHLPMFRVSARPPTGPDLHPPTHVSCVCTATYWSRPAPTHTCSVCLHGLGVSAGPPTGPGLHPPTRVPCVRMATHWSRRAPTHTYSVYLHGHLLVQACANPHMFRVSAWPPTGPGLHPPTRVPCVHGHLLVQACTHPHMFRVSAWPPTGPGLHPPTRVPSVHGHLLVQACTHPHVFRVTAWPPTGPDMHPPTHVPCPVIVDRF